MANTLLLGFRLVGFFTEDFSLALNSSAQEIHLHSKGAAQKVLLPIPAAPHRALRMDLPWETGTRQRELCFRHTESSETLSAREDQIPGAANRAPKISKRV